MALEIHLEDSRPDEWAHREAFGTEIRFTLPRNAIVFPGAELTSLMPYSDSQLLAIIKQPMQLLRPTGLHASQYLFPCIHALQRRFAPARSQVASSKGLTGALKCP